MKKTVRLILGMAILGIALMSCEKDNKKENGNENGNSSEQGIEKGAIRYLSHAGQEWVLTYDGFGDRSRADGYMEGMHIIVLILHSNKEFWMYVPIVGWMSYPYEEYLQEQGTGPDMKSVEELEKHGFKKHGTMTVIGKVCDVYEGTWDGEKMKYAYWQGLALYMESDAVIWVATAATFNVPNKAFNRSTIEVDWI